LRAQSQAAPNNNVIRQYLATRSNGERVSEVNMHRRWNDQSPFKAEQTRCILVLMLDLSQVL